MGSGPCSPIRDAAARSAVGRWSGSDRASGAPGSCPSWWRRARSRAMRCGRPSKGLRSSPAGGCGGCPRSSAASIPPTSPRRPELGAILRLALLASRPAAAWLDLDGIVALRMDDPGASASVQLDPWSYEKLDPEDWEEIGRLLARSDAVLTIGYTPGWVDDGDAERGELRVGGRRVERRPGDVHPSPLVDYRGRRAPSADCQAEFRAVADLCSRGLCTVEMHGYTHVHPELERWARAPTRHQKLGWYRELGPEVAGTLRRKAARRASDRPRPRALRAPLRRVAFGARVPGERMRPGVARASLCPGARGGRGRRAGRASWRRPRVAPRASATLSRTRTALGPWVR